MYCFSSHESWEKYKRRKFVRGSGREEENQSKEKIKEEKLKVSEREFTQKFACVLEWEKPSSLRVVWSLFVQMSGVVMLLKNWRVLQAFGWNSEENRGKRVATVIRDFHKFLYFSTSKIHLWGLGKCWMVLELELGGRGWSSETLVLFNRLKHVVEPVEHLVMNPILWRWVWWTG